MVLTKSVEVAVEESPAITPMTLWDANEGIAAVEKELCN